MANLEKRLGQAHLEEFFTAGTLVSSVGATLASTSPDSGADTDSRNENIRNINNLVLDVAATQSTLNTLITTLKDKKILRS